MLFIIVNILCVIGGVYFLAKAGISPQDMNKMWTGTFFFSTLSAIANIILSAIAFSPMGMIGFLVQALVSGFFTHLFAKRAGLIE